MVDPQGALDVVPQGRKASVMASETSHSSGQAMGSMPDSRASRLRAQLVVGFSTMTSSQNAVRWAAAEAELRMSGLCIVHAYALPQLGQPMQHDVGDLLHNGAAALLDRIADSTRRDHPQLEITIRLIQGAPINALRDSSAGADLTVVGAKKSGRVSQAILGSVASAIAAVNPAPIAVVHADHPVDGSGPIVLGVDGSSANSAAIEFAFTEAAVRNTELVAVHTWNTSLLIGDVPDYPSILAKTGLEQEATAMLSKTLTRWGSKYPDVAVTHVVRRGRAATVLLEYSRSASMVVVGRRPRGEFQALVMGSTSRALTAHSPCPVVIVHPRTDR
jgi:nucleotide-binding universal stress UspA family protein